MSTWHIIRTAFSIGFGVFILWMLVDCIRSVDDKDDRVIWAMFILFGGVLFAPVYFVQRYLPRRKESQKGSHHDA